MRYTATEAATTGAATGESDALAVRAFRDAMRDILESEGRVELDFEEPTGWLGGALGGAPGAAA
jgi:hypothetical protein